VLDGLQPRPGGTYIDGTLGAGGHAAGLLAGSAPTGRLLGLDRDPAALAAASVALAPFGERARLVQASYTDMAAQAARQAQTGWPDFLPVDGVLLDLGLSSLQLADPARGFAFQTEGPLDMRFDPGAPLTADEIVNTWPVDELADIIYRYGEEPHARRLARAIEAARPLGTTRDLAEVIERAAGRRRGERTHPATRTFQALRIVVNGELEAVEAVLPAALGLLRPGGRLAVISFHSLEDRLVKTFMRRLARGQDDPGLPAPLEFVPEVREVTRKPVTAAPDEVARNPRARSAKLRIVEKI
jgi:16S rRNA (cytosine1402-N4)-methyltransferase